MFHFILHFWKTSDLHVHMYLVLQRKLNYIYLFILHLEKAKPVNEILKWIMTFRAILLRLASPIALIAILYKELIERPDDDDSSSSGQCGNKQWISDSSRGRIMVMIFLSINFNFKKENLRFLFLDIILKLSQNFQFSLHVVYVRVISLSHKLLACLWNCIEKSFLGRY